MAEITYANPGSRQRAYGGEIPNQVQTPNKGSPLEEGETRKRDENLSQKIDEEKGHPTPPYIGQGGGQPPSTSHVGLIPRGEGWRTLEGVGPSLGAMAQGGDSLFP